MTKVYVDQSSTGVGICGLLTIVFVILKAFEKIDWSWWWVFSPLWLPFAVVVGIWIFCLIVWLFCIIIGKIVRSIKRRKRNKKPY